MSGQHYWSTGAQAKELDLAGLVCNNLKEDDPDANQCINPCRGQEGGDTWEYRRGYVDGVMSEYQRANRKK